MKKMFLGSVLCLLISAVLVGCGNQAAGQESQMTTIGNPWTEWDSVEEAEAAVGFRFGLPTVIADSYDAVEVRTMNNELIEVVYRDETFEVCVRKQAGEGQDISGDYNEYEICTETNCNEGTLTEYRNSGDPAMRQTVSYEGYSWSLVAPDGYWGDSNAEFLNHIWEQ